MTHSLPDIPADSPSTWRILDLFLVKCEVDREFGDPSRPKSAEQKDFTIEASFSDGVLTFVVASEHVFLDEEDESVARVKVAFRTLYAVGKEPPAQEAVSAFQASVVMQTVPFLREFVASMTSRMGIPRFLVPLLRRSDFDFESLRDEDTARAVDDTDE